MSLKHFPVHFQSENFNKLINHPVIKFFLVECEGYIAGGLAEKEHRGDDIGNYLKRGDGTYNGDIDMYFRTKLGFEKALDYAYNNSHTSQRENSESMELNFPSFDNSSYDEFMSCINFSSAGRFNQENYDRERHIRYAEKSCTDISHQLYVDVKLINTRTDEPVKVQLIGKDFIGKIEDVLNTFDFANVQIAYYIKNNTLFCCKNEKLSDRLSIKQLEIVNSHSPLLMHRVNKYLTHRGYKGISEDSKQHIIDWLIKARSGHFKNPILGITLWEDSLNNNIIKRAIFNRTIPDDALPLIIGKVITERKVYRGYRRYDYVKIDEALEAIKERKENS